MIRYTTNTIVPKPEKAKGGEGKKKGKKKQEKRINVTPFNQTIESWYGGSPSPCWKGLGGVPGMGMVVNF